MILSLFLILQSAFALDNPALIYKNNSAVKLFEKEKLLESKIILENEVVNNPKAAELHYNLGFVHENSKEPEKSIQEYLAAAKTTKDKNLQFQSNFNAARVYGEQKNIPDALKYYQAALELNPNSQEVKTNIEMLLQNKDGGGKDSQEDQKPQEDQQKDQQGKNEQPKPQEPNKNEQQKKPAPKPFKSDQLTEQDVKRVLEELKRQEEQIRAKMNNEKSKETPVDKDW